VFVGVAALHFVLSVAGQVLALRVAFDSRPGGAPKPFETAVVRLAELLLTPLNVIQHAAPGLSTPSGYLETAVTSASFGIAAAGMLWLLRRRSAVRRRL
jgi:hypothetical protein